MVSVIRPEWQLREATLADAGWTSLYHLTVETEAGERTCVLKASPFEDRPAPIDVEARIHTIVADHTTIPVPSIIGVVDAHDSLRTPYILMETLSGETLSPTDIRTLSDSTLRRIARETGGYLAQLHDIEVGLDAFGEQVEYQRAHELKGERPTADPSRLVVVEGYQRWAEQLYEWFEADFQELADSRFEDLAPALRAEQARRVNALPATFTPVLGRTDTNWDNQLIDRERGTITGVIDWEQLPVVTSGFSLASAEEGLATKRAKWMPEVSDRRPLVWSALQSGFGEETTVPSNLTASRDCYRLNFLIRDMALFDERLESSSTLIPSDRIKEAATGYREAAEAALHRDAS